MPNAILKDNNQQHFFDENGYTVIDLLSQSEIAQLQTIFNKYLNPGSITAFTSTNIINSKEWRVKIADEIDKITKQSLNDVFQNTKFWNPAFLIKPVGNNTEFKLHQDWTFVDEDNYYSGNIWIPLEDSNYDNGTICVLPKSHYKYVKTLRSQTIHELFRGREDVLKKYGVPVNLKAGQAVIFQHSLVHYTPSNNSTRLRIAVTCGFNSKDATLLTHYKDENNRITTYAMPDNFVFDYGTVDDLGLRPANGRALRETAYHPSTTLSDMELIAFFQR